MVGRLDDWVRAVASGTRCCSRPAGRSGRASPCSSGHTRSITERGYRTRLLGGAFRHHLAWTQLLGGDTILTIPPAWQRWLNASGLPVEARIGESVDPAILNELAERVPEFRLAYEPDGLAPDELEDYGASRRTMRQFLAAYADLHAEVRDAILPDPDRKPVPA